MTFALLDDDVDDSAYFYDWDAHQKAPEKVTFWTVDRVEVLTDLWLKGRNAKAIGRLLGCSKNAVIGKANRLLLEHGSLPDNVLEFGR